MNTKDYITIIAIEKLLKDETLPADIRTQAEQIRNEILVQQLSIFDGLQRKGE